MSKTECELVREMNFYTEADLPPESMIAWFKGLSKEEQEIIQNYILRILETVKISLRDLPGEFYQTGLEILNLVAGTKALLAIAIPEKTG